MTTPAPALPSDQHHTQQQQHHHQHSQQSAASQHTMIGAEQPSASPMAPAPVNGHKRATRSPEPRPSTEEQHVAPVEPAAKKIRTGEDAMEEQIQEAVQSEGHVSNAQTPAVPSAPAAAPSAPAAAAPVTAAPTEQVAPRAPSPLRASSIPPPSPKKAPIHPTEMPPTSTPVPAPAKADEEMKDESHAMEVDAVAPAAPAAPSFAAPAPVAEAPKEESASPSVAPTSAPAPAEKVPAMGTYPDCMIFTPPRFGVQEPEQNEALNKEQLKFCAAALRQMKKHKPTIDAFLAPVDPVAMGIPQYPQFVKEPMDVSTIERKMQQNQYANAQAFVNDVYLMVNNAIIFNRPDHFVHTNAHKLKSWFDGYMSRLPTTVSVRSFGTPKTKLADIDTRPKRDVNPPKDLLTASPLAQTPNPLKKTTHDPSRQRDDLKIASLVLKEVMKPRHINVNAIFLEPVDPIALNIPTYFDVIKQPMDLSTIKRKLEHNQYPTLDAFESDMRIMINNCLTFNHPADPVYAMGVEFQRLFNKELAAKADAFVAEPTLSAADQEEESRISIEVDLIEKNIAELQSRLAPLKDRLAVFQQKRRPSSSTAPSTMKKKHHAMHRTPKNAHHTPAHAKTTSKKASRAPHYAGARAAPATGAHHGMSAGDAGKKLLTGNKPLTLEQKQQLSQAVSRMNDDDLALVVDMIKKSMPSLFGSSDEIELDIESIDDRTQRDLYNFAVGNAAPATEKKNPAAGRLEQLSGALQQERKQERSHYSSGSEDDGSDSE